MSSGIFISYRRTGGLETARNLRDRLASLNYKVFFDMTSMHEGKFNQQLFEEIKEADDFVLILSEGSLDRCVEEGDWLRLEIQRALLLHKNIIPIWKPAFEGFPPSLPPDISDIRHYDSVKLSEEYYDAFFQKVVVRLKSKRTISEDLKPIIDTSGKDSRFVTFIEWLNKNKRFAIIRFFLWFFHIATLLAGIGLLIASQTGNADKDSMVYGAGLLVVAMALIFPARFVSRIKRKCSPDIAEVEQSNRRIKLVKNLHGEVGLIQVGFSRVDILLPCKYFNIQKLDRNNYILLQPEGRSLYNRKRKEIVGQGPYEKIMKTKYKIECFKGNRIELFSLDGYRRFD